MSDNRALVRTELGTTYQINEIQNGTFCQISETVGLTIQTSIDIPREIRDDQDAVASYIQNILNQITEAQPAIHFIVSIGPDDEKMDLNE